MYRRLTWILFGLLAGVAAVGIPSTGQDTQNVDRDAQAQRRKQLVKALKSDLFVSYRAAEEMAISGNIDKSGWKALIELIASKTGPGLLPFVSARYIDALAAAGSPAVPDILAALQKDDPQKWGDFPSAFLLSLGRMGPAAKEAIPSLRRMLADPRTEGKVALRIVLANIGDESKVNLEAILAEFRKGEQGDYVGIYVTFPYIRPREWLTKEMIEVLGKPLQRTVPTKPGDPLPGECTWAVVTFGILGERAMSLADTLESRAASIPNCDGLALARIDPKRREAALRRLLEKPHPPTPGGVDFKGQIVVLDIAWLLLDSEVAKGLAKFVDNPDPEVAAWACDILSLGGLAARDAAPMLLKYIRSEADEDRRAEAARTLSWVADNAQLPALDTALRAEKSGKVRAALESTVRWIKYLSSD